jgi:hypothetical protein
MGSVGFLAAFGYGTFRCDCIILALRYILISIPGSDYLYRNIKIEKVEQSSIYENE